MKVTIVVRTYKRPLFLKEALASIHLQTHKDWEVLIFDDGGLSETFSIYKNFKKENKDKRILFFSSNQPYYYFKESWKIAPKISEGEIMVRLDDDDLLSVDSLEYLSNTYTEHKDLDFSYGSTIFFEGNELKNKVITQTPLEPPKTKDIWEGYLEGHPWNKPWRFKMNHYEEPKNYTSIVHCSKANIMCIYHTYVMRTSSILKVLDKFDVTSNFVDDLEVMGSLDYLGLKHTAIKRTLTYCRIHNDGRVTDKQNEVEGQTLWNNILWIRDKVDFLRKEGFESTIYLNTIENNKNQQEIHPTEQLNFKEYTHDIQSKSELFG
jgi:glycosyltransferase involved in cell wall biosynthesis